MITNAIDYEFVNFASGDLPTGGFDGWIMPRRSDPQSPHPVDMLKAEDIAFLIECVRDKVGAFKGLVFPSYDFIPGGYAPAGTDPGKVTPTKSISSSQMRNIRSYTTTQLGRGFPSQGIGFLSTPLSEVASFQLSAGANLLERAWAIATPQFAGTWAPTSQVTDFATGQPVLSAPVEAIFDDAKNLVRPVWSEWSGDPFVTNSHLHLTTLEGTPPSGITPFFGYRTSSYNTTTPWAVRGNFNASEYIKFTHDFLSSAKVWLLYVARNDLTGKPNTSTPTFSEYRAGLIRLDTYLRASSTTSDFDWYILPDRSTALYNRILSDCGWTEYPSSAAAYQQILPLYYCAIIIEGIPNGRTQWWT